MTGPAVRARALGTRTQDAAMRTEAARELLQRPVISADRDPELHALIRRHATHLRSMFDEQYGYALVVEASFARLIKRPLEASSPARTVRRSNGTPLGARGLSYVALAGAALMAPGVGEQILVGTLVSHMRADAEQASITLTEAIADRRTVAAALAVLTDWGVLTEIDGTISAWAENPNNDALLTISRDLLDQLLARPIGPTGSIDAVLTPHDDDPARRLRRRLVEDPVVHRAALTEAELDVLAHDRSAIARDLDDHVGLTLEVRAEGALAYDADGRLSDIEFPGSGSLKHAALLVIGAALDRLPTPAPGADLVIGFDVLDELLTALTEVNQRSWKSEYVASVPTLRSDIVELLRELSLASVDGDRMVLHAPAARYRPTEELR